MTIPVAFLGGSPGAGEILLVLLVVLLLFGAKHLPSIARSLGRTLDEFRRTARDLSHDIMSHNNNSDSHGISSNVSSLPEQLPDKKKV